jgi:tRNA-2-methylthio-N6-dimethylallyladenosine synthase
VNRVYIKTYGCQMNERDSEAVAAMLRGRGYRIVTREDECDVMLLNTCSVRDKAEQKVFSHLGRLRELKRDRDITIGVCGCVAQQEGERILERAPWVDFVMGPGNVGHLDQVLDGGARLPYQLLDCGRRVATGRGLR